MDTEKLLSALSDSELTGVLSATPFELERHGTQVPVLAGTLAVTETVRTPTPNTPEQAQESNRQHESRKSADDRRKLAVKLLAPSHRCRMLYGT